jgi:hypothetical protein
MSSESISTCIVAVFTETATPVTLTASYTFTSYSPTFTTTAPFTFDMTSYTPTITSMLSLTLLYSCSYTITIPTIPAYSYDGTVLPKTITFPSFTYTTSTVGVSFAYSSSG